MKTKRDKVGLNVITQIRVGGTKNYCKEFVSLFVHQAQCPHTEFMLPTCMCSTIFYMYFGAIIMNKMQIQEKNPRILDRCCDDIFPINRH